MAKPVKIKVFIAMGFLVAAMPSWPSSYIHNVVKQLDSLSLATIKKVIKRDKKYCQRFQKVERYTYGTAFTAQKKLLEEMTALQQAIDQYLRLEHDPETGLRYYSGESVGQGGLLLDFYMRRFAIINGEESYQVPYFMNFFNKNHLSYRRVEAGSFQIIKEAIKQTGLAPKLTQDITFSMMPFKVKGGNGWAAHDKKTGRINILLMTQKPSHSLVVHEFGHAVHKKILGYYSSTKTTWKAYQKLRGPRVSKTRVYDNLREAFAEDFRVLFANSEAASFRRSNPGAYGDIRSNKNRQARVKKFMKEAMQGYKKSAYGYRVPGLVFPRVLRPGQELKVEVYDDSQQYRYTIYDGVTVLKNRTWQTLKAGENLVKIPAVSVGKAGLYKIEIRNEAKPDYRSLEFLVY